MIESNRIEITSTGGLSTMKNIEDFYTGFTKPINRELMRIFKDLELVEHLGSGMGRILPIYGRDSFQITENFMRNIFYKSIIEPEGVIEGISSVEMDLLDLIQREPGNRTPYYAKQLNTSTKNVERWLKTLRDKQLIAFKGSPKIGGYWKINTRDTI